MTITFPIPLTDFFAGLPIQTGTPDLSEAIEQSQTGSGEILTANLGPRLWKMDVELRLGSYAEMEAIKAKLQTLRYAGRSLIVHSFPLVRPQYDPTGAILGGSVATLNSVQANNRELQLAGLPANYELRVGDFLSFTYGTNPVRYAMHQVVTGGKVPGGGGLTSLIEVVPFVQPGWSSGAPVRLIKPMFKAIVVPGSYKPAKSGQQVTDGIAFSLTQTLR